VNLFTIYLGLEIFPGTHREYYRLHQLHWTGMYSVSQINLRTFVVLQNLFVKEWKFLAIFHAHIPQLNVLQRAKFYSVIPNFDKVVPCSPSWTRECFWHFT